MSYNSTNDNGINEKEEVAENCDIVIESSPSDSLLFAYQSSWIKRLLRTYGNDICLLDATYKTTHYAVPLFFIEVKTNVDYEIVGAFVSEGKGAENIMSALNILESWNPNWSALYSNVDCCSEEINATKFLA